MSDPTSPLRGGDLDSSFYTANNGDNANAADVLCPNPPSPASSIGSAPVDSLGLRNNLYLTEVSLSTATGPTEDTSLTDTMSRMGAQFTRPNPPTSLTVTHDDIFRVPNQEEMDYEEERWKQHVRSDLSATLSTAKSTKKDTTKLLNKAEEESEAAAMRHAESMLAQEALQEIVEEGQEEILETVSLQHMESSNNQADMLANQKDMLSKMSTLLIALEDAQASGNAALVKKCKQEIEDLKNSNENLKAKLRTERAERLKAFREKKKMEQELKATKYELARMTPQKPRRGLAPIPTNFSAKPPTKRMVAAEMKHVGLKTDVALVDAEGVKRGNSSTLLP